MIFQRINFVLISSSWCCSSLSNRLLSCLTYWLGQRLLCELDLMFMAMVSWYLEDFRVILSDLCSVVILATFGLHLLCIALDIMSFVQSVIVFSFHSDPRPCTDILAGCGSKKGTLRPRASHTNTTVRIALYVHYMGPVWVFWNIITWSKTSSLLCSFFNPADLSRHVHALLAASYNIKLA